METVTEHKSLNVTSEPNVFTGVELNANQNPKRAKSTKKEVKTMKNETKAVAKEILDQNNTNNKCYKGKSIMDENLINGDDSEYDCYFDAKDLGKYAPEYIVLTRSQYDKLKPIIVASKVKWVDLMYTLFMYCPETKDANVRYLKTKTRAKYNTNNTICSLCYECEDKPCDIVRFSFPHITTGKVIDLTKVDDIALFDYVATDIYGGLH